MKPLDAAELTLYRELFSELQTGRGEVNRSRGSRGRPAGAFPQIMEKQNTLKAKTASILDSLLAGRRCGLKG